MNVKTIIFILFMGVCMVCSNNSSKKIPQDPPKAFLKGKLYSPGKITYPANADKKRRNKITENMNSLEIGMIPDEVRSLFSAPDTITPLYTPKKKKPEIIGFTYLYLLRYLDPKESHSLNEEESIRVQFDLKGHVVRAFAINVYGFNNLIDTTSTLPRAHCTNWDDIEKHLGEYVTLTGVLEEWKSQEKGYVAKSKNPGRQYWNWQITLSDSIGIPIGKMTETDQLENLAGNQVWTFGHLHYGIVIGSPEESNATGARLDIIKIKEVQE